MRRLRSVLPWLGVLLFMGTAAGLAIAPAAEVAAHLWSPAAGMSADLPTSLGAGFDGDDFGGWMSGTGPLLGCDPGARLAPPPVLFSPERRGFRPAADLRPTTLIGIVVLQI
jgi:hypothetical protein